MDRAGHELTPNERLLAALAYLQWWVAILIALATDVDRQPYARYHGMQAVGLGLAIQVVYLLVLLPVSLVGLVGLLAIGLAMDAPYLIILWFPVLIALAGLIWLPHLYFAYAAYTRNAYFHVPLVGGFMESQGWLARPEMDPVPVASSEAAHLGLPVERAGDAGNRVLAAISYLAWWLAVVVLLVSREGRRPYASFHAVQGLALEIILVVLGFVSALLLVPLHIVFILAGGALGEDDSTLVVVLAVLGLALYVTIILAVSVLPWLYRIYLAGRAIIAGDYFSIPFATRFMVNQGLLDLPGTQDNA